MKLFQEDRHSYWSKNSNLLNFLTFLREFRLLRMEIEFSLRIKTFNMELQLMFAKQLHVYWNGGAYSLQLEDFERLSFTANRSKGYWHFMINHVRRLMRLLCFDLSCLTDCWDWNQIRVTSTWSLTHAAHAQSKCPLFHIICRIIHFDQISRFGYVESNWLGWRW